MAVAYVVYGVLVGVCNCIVHTVGWVRDGGQHSRAGVLLLPLPSRMGGGTAGASLYDGPVLRCAPVSYRTYGFFLGFCFYVVSIMVSMM